MGRVCDMLKDVIAKKWIDTYFVSFVIKPARATQPRECVDPKHVVANVGQYLPDYRRDGSTEREE